jgi:DNA adenine methylase
MIRSRFNKYKDPNDFMFIMRTTTNGMPRYNRNGDFNNSFHVTRDGIQPDKLQNIVHDWNTILNRHGVVFICQDYKNIKSESGDVLYLDPPYFNTKGMYYGAINYDDLWQWIKQQVGDYFLSFDGKTTNIDCTIAVPEEIYTSHEYIYSGNSSFRRVIGNSNSEYVYESLYSK